MNSEKTEVKNHINKYSIIVPVYNCETYLSRLFESILNQSCKDFEVIAVDDGSTDSSGQICDFYAEKDSRISVLHKQNGGVSSARNAGIAVTTAQYIVFVDSDDYLDSTFLEDFGESETDLVIGGYVIENSEKNVLLVKEYPETSYSTHDNLTLVKEHFIAGLYNYACTKRFKRKVIVENQLRFDCDLSLGEDTLFVTDFICHANDIKTISSHGYHYVKYDHQTLTNQPLIKQLIQKLESANDAISDSLRVLFGNDAEQITAMRMSPLYKNILLEVVDRDVVDKEFLSFLFRQKWFRRAISTQGLFADENWKFRVIINSRSAALLSLFLIFKKRKNNSKNTDSAERNGGGTFKL